MVLKLVSRYEGDVEEFLSRSALMHKGKVNIIHSSFDPVDISVEHNREYSDSHSVVCEKEHCANKDE